MEVEMQFMKFLTLVISVFLIGKVILGAELLGVPILRGEKYIKIDYDKVDLEKFAEHIKSRKIYDHPMWGDKISSVQVHNALIGTSSILEDKFLPFQLNIEIDKLTNWQSANKQKYLSIISTKRKKICIDIISLQNFFETAIDRNCPKNNPFFNDIWIEDPMFEWGLQMSNSDNSRYLELQLLKIENKLSNSLKLELEQYEKKFNEIQEKHDKWEFEKIEYYLQKSLINNQKETLKKSHKYLVKLYSLEPRADGELLELFSKSKYPETEKVKILMELKIPYKNYRRWESQDRKFQTNAQFIALDKPTQNVTLEKPNGKKTVVKLYVLRYADKKYIQDLLNEKQK
jgi:hypothetical protein